MAWILNEKKIKKGDIILTRNDSKISQLIREIAKSEFSHAILYLGNHSFMEADTNGVEFFSTQRYAFKDKGNISIRRLKELNEGLIDQLIENARKYSYRDYDMEGVKNMYRNNMKGIQVSPIESMSELNEWNKPLFCSQLIGVVFKQSGLSLYDGSLDSFSPLEIESSTLLEIIDDCLIEIPDELCEQYTLHEEGSLPENVLSKQTELSQLVSIEVKKQYKANQLPIPADFQDAIDKLSQLDSYQLTIADKIISEELKKSGFLELWKENEKLYPYLYNPFLLMQQWNLDSFNEMQPAIEHLTDLITSINQTIDFQLKNLTTTENNHEQTGLETYKLLSEMYRGFISDLERAKSNVEVALTPIQKIYNIIKTINNGR
jgi:hypothetical protein